MVDRLGFEIFPELRPGQKATEAERGSPTKFRMARRAGFTPDSTGEHVKDFIDCVRSRHRPAADIQRGHQASTVAHLINVAYRTGRKLRWDPAAEQIVDDPGAAKLLAREPRPPWDRI